MHSERIFKVQIPDELKDNYKSGLPAFREPKLEAGENQHNHRVQGETVAGTLHESGLFVYTLSSGYIPVFLENVQVLVELEKFLVDSPTRSESRGLHYKKEPDGDKVPNKVVKWGSFVYGMVVAENTNWVQVGEYYLPIEWNGHQVLYPAESWNAAPKSFAPDQTARLCLFAPHEGDYFVTGTFTKSWKTAWDLTPEPFSESRAKGFRGRIYYVDVPVQELNNAEFKFRFHEKGTWKQVTDFLYITEKLKWEYDSLNNRTVKLDGRVAPGSKLFMYWGFPEASEQHVMEFLKVVLSGPGLNGLDEAMRRVDEVRQSVRQVTCKWPTARRTSVEQFDRLIPLALRDVLDSRPPAGPQPCSGVFVWMAVLEQRTRGNLSMLHHIRPEVVSVVAKWPPDIMSDARLAGCVHAAAKSALREEARNTSRKLSGQWLQAAIQVILHSETSIAEIPGAELVERGVVPQWAEIRLKDAPQARIESALRIAFKPAHTLQEVFDAAKAFLDHADRRAWGPLCVQTALEEGLAWVERSMDWGAGANNLQRLLDCLDDARVDEKNLVDIIQKAWRRLGARPHIIPEPTGHLNQSTRIVSQALTAEPEDADFVEFEGSSAFSWLRLAVLASNYSADLPDVATVPLNALVALHLLSKDMLAMTRGVSIKTRDTGTEYTKSLDLPPQFKDGLDKLKEECPQVLAVVCRLVARTVYLASELPLDHDHRHDKEKFQKAPPLCMLVKQMDILDELAEVGEGKEEQAEELLEMPVPLDLEYWNDWNEGHAIAAVKIYRSLWSEIREPYLAPAKPVLAASNDPAVASGMAKGLATSGWLQPKVGRGRGPRRVKGFKKKDQDESEEDGDWEVIDPIDPTSPVKTRPVKAGRGNKSSAERQRQDQAGATFVGKVHYSGSWADELAAIMADKTAESYSVRTKGGQGSSIPFVAGGQPGELVSTPMSEDFPLIVIPKKAEANPHNPQRPQGLEGLDFMRDVLEKFINQRAGGPDHGRTIEKEDAKQVALAWDDVEMMGEALQPLLMPLGQDVDVTEERGRLVTEFHQHFEQQQNSMPRPIKDHVQPSQLQTCILEAKGWTLRKSPGDGHCQFHSVGFAVGEGHETVRSHALAWITQHREEYKMKMVVERNGTPASFTDTVEDDELESALDKYIARMSEGAWGDNITLHALAHHYQREIRVLTDNVKNAWVQIEPGFGNPIYVAFYAEFHYDSVITETPTL